MNFIGRQALNGRGCRPQATTGTTDKGIFSLSYPISMYHRNDGQEREGHFFPFLSDFHVVLCPNPDSQSVFLPDILIFLSQ